MECLLAELSDAAEADTLSLISHVECSPMPAVAIAHMEGRAVTQDEIVAASDLRAKQRGELLELFDGYLRVYAGYAEESDMFRSSVDYFDAARLWC